MKHLANLIDKKADTDSIKKIQEELGTYTLILKLWFRCIKRANYR